MKRYVTIIATIWLMINCLCPLYAWSADGACGDASGKAVTEKPAYSLCADYTTPQVYGDGPWTWTCSGSDGGTNASCSADIRSLNGLESYWPLHVGDNKTFSYGGKTLTTTVEYDGWGGYKLTSVSPDGSGSEYHQTYADKIRISKVKAGAWITVSFTPAIEFISESLITNGGTLVTNTSAKQTGAPAYPATFTVKVAMAGTVTVPAGTFHNCRSVTITEKATIPGQGTVNVTFMTAILAPKVGLIKKLVSPGVWAVLMSGTVDGVDLAAILAAEKNPPIGTISINNNAVATSTTAVSLDITASDATDVTAICISNSITCSSWQMLPPTKNYTATKNWALTAGDGLKTVFVWYRDSFWNISAPVKANITLDTVVPTLTVKSPLLTNLPTLTMTGTKSAGSNVTLTGPEGVVCATTAVTAAATTWSCIASGYAENGATVLTFTATDVAMNNSAATATITHDNQVPTATIAGTPPTPIKAGTYPLTIGGDGVVMYSWRLTKGSAAPGRWSLPIAVATKLRVAATTAGDYKVEVMGKDAAGNWQDKTAVTSTTWTVDAAAPVTTINAVPTLRSKLPTPSFVFSSEEGATFECKIDLGAYAVCNSPYTIPAPLKDGLHTFYVRSKDVAGNYDPTPDAYSWTVDTKPPALTVKQPAPVKTVVPVTITGTKETGATIVKTSPDSVTCTFTAATTKASTTWSCSATGYAQDASTSVEFIATDAAGNPQNVTATVIHDSALPTGTLLIKGTEPTDAYTNKAAVTLNLTCDGTGSVCNKMRFSNGAGKWSNWETYKPTKAWILLITNGEQTVSAEVKDAAENISSAPISDTIILHTVAPQTTIGDTKPAALTSEKTPTFSFSANETATFECKMDTSSYASCTSPYASPELKVGVHTFAVRAKDTAGNYDATPAAYVFTVKNDQTISFAPLDAKTYGDSAFKLNATSGSGLAVTYTSSNTAVATVSGNLVTIRGAGATTITARQAGNATYLPATPVEQILAVGKRPITVNLMKTTSVDASSPSIAMANDGRAIAVWSEGASLRTLWVNHYVPDSGWGTAYSVGTGVGDEAGAKVAVNSSGLAVLVWVRLTDDSKEVLAATYNPAMGWSTPTVLDSTQIGNHPDLTVSIDGDGSAAIFWQRFDSITNCYSTVMMSRHSIEGWEPPQQLLSGTSRCEQIISGNSSGELFAIWNEANPDPNDQFLHNYNTFVRSFKPGLGWSSSQSIGNDTGEMNGSMYYNPTTTPGHYRPRISIDSQGNALALWSEVYYQGDSYHMTVNRYDNRSGWGAPLSIGSISSLSSLDLSPFVTNDSGSFYVGLADCQYSYNSTLSNIFVASYKTDTGWSLDKIIDSLPYYCHSPLITVGKNGNLYLTWLQIDGNETHIWLKRYSPLSGWGSSYRIDNVSGSVGSYEAVRDSSGDILIIWTQDSGANSVVFAKRLN